MCLRLIELELSKIGVVPAEVPPPVKRTPVPAPKVRVYQNADDIEF